MTHYYPYDKGEWHDVPENLPIERAYVPTGFFVGWLIEKKLVLDPYIEEYPPYEYDLSTEYIQLFKSRKLSGPSIFESCGETFSASMLTDQGNRFTLEYFDAKQYFEDFNKVFGVDASSYLVKDTWENYDKISRQIEMRYMEWLKNTTPPPKFELVDLIHKLGPDGESILKCFVESIQTQLCSNHRIPLKPWGYFSKHIRQPHSLDPNPGPPSILVEFIMPSSIQKHLAEGKPLQHENNPEDKVFQAIWDNLSMWTSIKIPGVGDFFIHLHPLKQARNPETGNILTIPAKKILGFRPSKKLIDLIREEKKI